MSVAGVEEENTAIRMFGFLLFCIKTSFLNNDKTILYKDDSQ